MKITKRSPIQNTKKRCPTCGKNYLQNVYMFEKKKWVIKGLACPVCVEKVLKGIET